MKYYLLTAILFTSCLISAAELSKNEMKRLRDVSIGGTRIDDWRNDDREEFLVLEISIAHAPEDPREFDMSRFRVRLAVELTDKQKNKYVVQFTGSPTPDYPYEYLGEDFWKFYMTDTINVIIPVATLSSSLLAPMKKHVFGDRVKYLSYPAG